MNDKKPYIVAVVMQAVTASSFILAKAALDAGLGLPVFLFYRQVVGSLLLIPFTIVAKWWRSPQLPLLVLLKIFMLALIGMTLAINVYNIGLVDTSETVSSAIFNAIPVITFFMAFLLRMETLKIRSSHGIAKVVGVAFCLCGVMVVAFYAGPAISPLNHHHLFHQRDHDSQPSVHSKGTQIKGTFFLLFSALAWSLWLIMQGLILKNDCPSKLLLTTIQYVFSTFQSLVVALAFERDFSKWKLGYDVRIIGVIFCGFVGAGSSWCMQWCIQKKGPVFVAMSNPLTIVFTIFCGLLILGETILLGSIVGSIFMVAGLYCVLWGQHIESKVSNSSNENSEMQNNEEVSTGTN